jgi:hypothetical protein
MSVEPTQEDLDRIKFLENNINIMKAELRNLRKKVNINKDCINKKERYETDPEYRKERIEKSKLYYNTKIKPIMAEARAKAKAMAKDI